MAKDKIYPSSVYSGIHPDDEQSWGMCCSYEMACKCAEEHYDYEREKGRKFILKMFMWLVGIAIAIAIISGLVSRYNETHPKPDPVIPEVVCDGCGLTINPDDSYYEFLGRNYHMQCMLNTIGDKVIVHDPQ